MWCVPIVKMMSDRSIHSFHTRSTECRIKILMELKRWWNKFQFTAARVCKTGWMIFIIVKPNCLVHLRQRCVLKTTLGLNLLRVWSGWPKGAGQTLLIDSHWAYSAGRASPRRSGPVWPLSTPHFHNISGVLALQAGENTEDTTVTRRNSVPPRRHAAGLIGTLPELGEEAVPILNLLTGKASTVCSPLLPSLTFRSLRPSALTQHARCKVHNLFAPHLADSTRFFFKGPMQPLSVTG